MPNCNIFYTDVKMVPVGIHKTTTGCQLLTKCLECLILHRHPVFIRNPYRRAQGITKMVDAIIK